MARLTHLEVNKVSFVGKPANQRKFLLMKSRDAQSDDPDNTNLPDGKENPKMKKSVDLAVKALKSCDGDAKKFVASLRKSFKDERDQELTKSEIKFLFEAAEAVVDLEKSGRTQKSSLDIAVEILEKHQDDFNTFKSELKKALYADLSVYLSDDEAKQLFAAAASLMKVSKRADADPDNPGNTDTDTDTSTGLSPAVKAALEKRDKIIANLQKKLSDRDDSDELETTKKWLRKNAPFASDDLEKTAQEIVDVAKVSKAAAETLKKNLKRTSDLVDDDSDLFRDTGDPDRGDLDGTPTLKLDKVLRAAGDDVKKDKHGGSMLEAIDKAMDDDNMRDAYDAHRREHLRRAARAG